MSDEEMVLMGRVSGLFGVRGWIKVYSEASPREGILKYNPWYLRNGELWEAHRLLEGKRQGQGVVARLEGCGDRDQAAELMGREIAVSRNQLPELPSGEYYWADLEGLMVVNLQGVELGRVSHLFETGANDVLVVLGERERLIPYTWGEAVREVDLEAGRMTVDWDPEF
jgi:16S rRNA processing protein RimM